MRVKRCSAQHIGSWSMAWSCKCYIIKVTLLLSPMSPISCQYVKSASWFNKPLYWFFACTLQTVLCIVNSNLSINLDTYLHMWTQSCECSPWKTPSQRQGAPQILGYTEEVVTQPVRTNMPYESDVRTSFKITQNQIKYIRVWVNCSSIKTEGADLTEADPSGWLH